MKEQEKNKLEIELGAFTMTPRPQAEPRHNATALLYKEQTQTSMDTNSVHKLRQDYTQRTDFI